MSYTHLQTKTPRARKRHCCRVCGEAIEPGESHIVDIGAQDGQIITNRFHDVCRWYTWQWDENDWKTFDAGSISKKEVDQEFDREIGRFGV